MSSHRLRHGAGLLAALACLSASGLALTACVDGEHEPCALHGACAMTGRWNKVNEAVRQAFTGITLADMVKH